jgi:glucokinase
MTNQASRTSEGIALGIDIGGTTIKFGVVQLDVPTILSQSAISTPQVGALEMALQIGIEVHRILADFPEVRSIGVGVPGAMNRDRTVARYPPNLLGWKEEPFKAYLQEALSQYRIELDNDAKVATLAEAKLGAGRGLDYFFMTTLGTGVGGGIFADGKIFRGETGGAGEFGMVSIKYDEPFVPTSSAGCIEGYLGQRFLSIRTLERLRTENTNTSLRKFLDIGEIEPRDISLAAKAGDQFAQSILEEAGTRLGVGFANVAKLLDIHTFIVGGGVAEAGELILGPAQKALRENAMPNQRGSVRIIKAELGIRAGILGAALLATSTSS